MASYDSIWGIDIGQCALKAMRCRAGKNSGEIIADAFDFIEYPQILSQPDADAPQLVRDALEEFLKRNPVKGSHVAISVPGQRGLPRFVKLPPVESSKIPDLVKFEAKQQIPFPLEDVVWDFQQMPGGTEEDGFSMETEVGLFAMKREEVFRSLRPFMNAEIEVDIVQLTPISLFNYIVFDQMQDLPPPDKYDPEDPPESIVVMSLGTDTSDLVVTNGYRVWQRSIPLGGTHFTKAITKELKVTFSKAEHLKRNAMKTEDPRAIFQAMKPVFEELVTEVQRSLNFYNSLNKTAKPLKRIVALGNTMKLRGLQKFLAQKLEMQVDVVESFENLTGNTVVNAPQFEENASSFGVCYGLCIQALDRGVLGTNLLPGEIHQERLIRAKKPWAVAAAAVLLLGCGLGFVTHSFKWKTTKTDPYKKAFSEVDSVAQNSSTLIEEFNKLESEYDKYDKVGKNLAHLPERQMLWPDLVRAIHECLPQAGKTPEKLMMTADGKEIPIGLRQQIHISSIDSEYFPALEKWFTPKMQDEYKKSHPELNVKPVASTTPAEGDAPAEPAAPVAFGPTGPGYVIEIRGFHYHNYDDNLKYKYNGYIQNTLIKQLETKSNFKVKRLSDQTETMISLKDFGISYPVLAYCPGKFEVSVPNPYAPVTTNSAGVPTPMVPNNALGATGGTLKAAITQQVVVDKVIFILQFAWKPVTESEREEKRKADEKQRQAAPTS